MFVAHVGYAVTFNFFVGLYCNSLADQVKLIYNVYTCLSISLDIQNLIYIMYVLVLKPLAARIQRVRVWPTTTLAQRNNITVAHNSSKRCG